MKPIPFSLTLSVTQVAKQVAEDVAEVWFVWRRQKLPLYLFFGLCFNLFLAPAVYAATAHEFSRTQAWALGLLGLATIGLSVYLFVVMFVPEKF